MKQTILWWSLVAAVLLSLLLAPRLIVRFAVPGKATATVIVLCREPVGIVSTTLPNGKLTVEASMLGHFPVTQKLAESLGRNWPVSLTVLDLGCNNTRVD